MCVSSSSDVSFDDPYKVRSPLPRQTESEGVCMCICMDVCVSYRQNGWDFFHAIHTSQSCCHTTSAELQAGESNGCLCNRQSWFRNRNFTTEWSMNHAESSFVSWNLNVSALPMMATGVLGEFGLYLTYNSAASSSLGCLP